MKKILLIVAVVLCVAIAGTALAATVYYNANNTRNGTVSSDKYVVLSLDGSSDTSSILLNGTDVIYKIHCGVTKSGTATASATLTVTLVAGTEKTLTGVTATLYSDSSCADETIVTGKTQTGAGSFSVTGIDDTTDYWVKIHFAGAADAEALAAIGGSMTIDLTQAAA